MKETDIKKSDDTTKCLPPVLVWDVDTETHASTLGLVLIK